MADMGKEVKIPGGPEVSARVHRILGIIANTPYGLRAILAALRGKHGQLVRDGKVIVEGLVVEDTILTYEGETVFPNPADAIQPLKK